MTRSPIATQQWASANGIVLHGAEIVEKHGLGLGRMDLGARDKPIAFGKEAVQPENIKEPEHMWVRVPSNLVLTSETVLALASENKEFQRWLPNVNKLQEVDLLHRLLLFAMYNCIDPWSGYISTLPRKIGLPFSWTPQEIEALACTSLYEPTLARRLALDRSHAKFCSQVQVVPIKKWLLAYEWVTSRALTHPETGRRCMVPIVDLCNHSPNPCARYEVLDNSAIGLLPAATVEYASPIAKDKDLLIDYGERSSAVLLFNYGFVPPQSETTNDELRKLFDPEDPVIQSKLFVGLSAHFDDVSIKGLMSNGYKMLLELCKLPYSIRIGTNGEFDCTFLTVLASFDYLEFDKDDNLCIGETEITQIPLLQSISSDIRASITPALTTLAKALASIFKSRIESSLPSLSGLAKSLAENEFRLYENFIASAALLDEKK